VFDKPLVIAIWTMELSDNWSWAETEAVSSHQKIMASRGDDGGLFTVMPVPLRDADELIALLDDDFNKFYHNSIFPVGIENIELVSQGHKEIPPFTATRVELVINGGRPTVSVVYVFIGHEDFFAVSYAGPEEYVGEFDEMIKTFRASA